MHVLGEMLQSSHRRARIFCGFSGFAFFLTVAALFVVFALPLSLSLSLSQAHAHGPRLPLSRRIVRTCSTSSCISGKTRLPSRHRKTRYMGGCCCFCCCSCVAPVTLGVNWRSFVLMIHSKQPNRPLGLVSPSASTIL